MSWALAAIVAGGSRYGCVGAVYPPRRLGIEPLALTDEMLERIEELAGGGSGGGALALLSSLPVDQRIAVQGRVLEERDYADLARTLECSQSVVRQRVSRGLRSLRGRLEQMR